MAAPWGSKIVVWQCPMTALNMPSMAVAVIRLSYHGNVVKEHIIKSFLIWSQNKGVSLWNWPMSTNIFSAWCHELFKLPVNRIMCVKPVMDEATMSAGKDLHVCGDCERPAVAYLMGTTLVVFPGCEDLSSGFVIIVGCISQVSGDCGGPNVLGCLWLVCHIYHWMTARIWCYLIGQVVHVETKCDIGLDLISSSLLCMVGCLPPWCCGRLKVWPRLRPTVRPRAD